MKIVILNGPLAGGKTTLGRALANTLTRSGQKTIFYDLDDEVERINGCHEFDSSKEKRNVWLAARKNYAMKADDHARNKETAVVVGPFYKQDEIGGFIRYISTNTPILLFTLNVPLQVRLERNTKRSYPNNPKDIESQTQAIDALHDSYGYQFDNNIDLEEAVKQLVDLIGRNEGKIKIS